MERRSERTITDSASTRSGTIVDARMTLALWLRDGRARRGMSLEQVSKVTKIQPRILERLEAGSFEGLPADVFIRGFVRSFAKCVGLDEDEALRRYKDAAAQPPGPTASARALVESMSELAPSTAYRATPQIVYPAEIAPPGPLASGSFEGALPTELRELPAADDVELAAEPVEATAAEPGVAIAVEPGVVITAAIVPVEATDAEPAAKKKRGRRGGKGRNKHKDLATGTPSSPLPAVAREPEATASVVEPAVAASVVEPAVNEPVVASVVEPTVVAPVVAASAAEPEPAPSLEPAASDPWLPKMPTVVAPSVPWRRTYAVATPSAPLIPSLVIDDADPDSAERELEERASKEPVRRSFLPPILLDREDRSARQGGLTLAVILLLIAATLTLSYLMRRPSSSGDGVTRAPATAPLVPLVPDLLA